MQPRSAKYLFDIRDCGEFVMSVTRGLTKEQFLANRLVRDAVERNFITIGEALNQLGQEDPALEKRIDPQGQIVAFRNIVVHGYHSLDYDRVWVVVENGLPALVSLISKMLEEWGPRPP